SRSRYWVHPEGVWLVFVMFLWFLVLMCRYPWQVLTFGTLAYLACLPLGWFSYREHQRREAAAATATVTATTPTPGNEELPSGQPGQQSDKERPARLN